MSKTQTTQRRAPSQDGISCRVEQRAKQVALRVAAFHLNVAQHGYSISDLTRDFPDDDTIERLAEMTRWGNNRRCPRCNSTRTKQTPNRKPMPYYCPDCRRKGSTPKYFSVTTGTPLECLGMSWTKVLHCLYFLAAQHEGISAPQIAEYAGIDETTALDLRRKVHRALPDEFCHQFAGPTEVDESYLGGSESKKHKKDKKGVRGRQDKKCVLGAVDRATRHVRLQLVETPDYPTIKTFVHSVATLGSKIFTDGYCVYQQLVAFWHEFVNHGAGEYVRNDVHTNNVENLFDRLDRALYPLRSVREAHLPGYLVEIQWLRNLVDSPVLVRMGVILSFLLRAEFSQTQTGPTGTVCAVGGNSRTTSSGTSAIESLADGSQGQWSLSCDDGDDGIRFPSGADQRNVAKPSAAKSTTAEPRQRTDRGGDPLTKPRSGKKHHPLQGVLPACWD